MTGTEMRKLIKKTEREKSLSTLKISVSIGEHEEGEYTVMANCWMYDRWGYDDFHCFNLDTLDNLKDAEKKAKRLSTTLGNHFKKVNYEGLENA